MGIDDTDLGIENIDLDIEDTYIDEEKEAELSRISEEMKIDEYFENLFKKYQDFYFEVRKMVASIDKEIEKNPLKNYRGLENDKKGI